MIPLILNILNSQTHRGIVEWWLPAAGRRKKQGVAVQQRQSPSYVRGISSRNHLYNLSMITLYLNLKFHSDSRSRAKYSYNFTKFILPK